MDRKRRLAITNRHEICMKSVAKVSLYLVNIGIVDSIIAGRRPYQLRNSTYMHNERFRGLFSWNQRCRIKV